MKPRVPRIPGPSVLLAAVFGAGALLLSNVAAVPLYTQRPRTVTETLAPEAGSAAAAGVSRTRTVGGPGAAGGAACAAGRNAGATDTGVTASAIKLGATVVRSGIGKSFLAGAPVAMQAVVDRVNRAGGICGRLLQLKMVDDGWSAQLGLSYLRSLISDGVFAIPVSPSSQGVNELINARDLRDGGIPLVGADGMVKSMYRDPWVWPVATSTVSTMHIIVQDAWRRGARTFGIVFAKDYRFGVEGAVAFNQEVKRLSGGDVPGFNANLSTCEGTFCGIISGQGSYGTDAEKFGSNCRKSNPKTGLGQSDVPGTLPSCDFLALLLEPKTALQWLQSGGPIAQGRMTGPQPLFNTDFAKSCGAKCQDMIVWTSYNPPLDPFRNSPAIAEYMSTVRLRDPSIDLSNQFTEGAYLGMMVFVDALRRVGPNLTRAALKGVLDTETFDFGLSPPLNWGGSHLAHGSMQSYALRYNGNVFLGFQRVGGFVRDASLGRDL